MKVLKIIIDLLNKVFIETITADIAMYICAGAVLLAFIIPMIMALTGDLAKFKGIVSKIEKGRKNDENFKLSEAIKKSPSLFKMYRAFLRNSSNPSDSFSYDLCVSVPYSKAMCKKTSKIVLVATAVFTFAMYALGQYILYSTAGTGIMIEGIYIASLAVALFGGLLALIAAVISGGCLKSANKKYVALMDILGGLGGGAADDADIDEPVVHARAHEHNHVDVSEDAEVEVEVDANVVVEQNFDSNDIEVEPANAYVETNFNNDFSAQQQPDMGFAFQDENMQPQFNFDADNVVVDAPSIVEDDSHARAEAERIAEQNRLEAERLAEEERVNQARLAAEARAEEERAAAALAAEQAKKSSAATEDVIARIEQISRDGAPLPVIKEVVALLQAERAKPENKTPEQQRKLSEASALLLKAMSNANKK